MTKLVLCLLCVLVVVPGGSVSSQTHQSRAADPVLTAIRSHEPDYFDPKTRRLEVLTEIWGNVGLYDPRPSARQLKWDDVLIAALRELPQVRSEHEFADLINRVVLAPIQDPLVYATTRAEDYTPISFPPAGTTRMLAGGTAYVSATNRAYAPATFARTLRTLVDSITNGRSVERIIIDLRSDSRTSYREGVAAPWLGMWARAPLGRGQDVSVLRTTEDNLGEVRWMVTSRDSLTPISPSIALPTVFLVNRTSYAAVEHTLDAVRTSRPDVAVVFEKSGPIPNLGYNPFQSWYPESILLSHSHVAMLAADGALGSVVDVTLNRSLGPEELETVADSALAVRATQKPRVPFGFADARLRDDTVTLGPLTGEQWLAGLLKTWFWVRHFYAYLDDASVDWRHLLSTWVPRIQAAKSDREYYVLLSQISGLLNDTHSNVEHPLSPFINPGSSFRAPLRFGWIQDRLAVTRVDTSDASLGVERGDEVLAVDGKRVQDIERELSPLYSVSFPKHHVPTFFVLGPKDSRLSLRIRTRKGVHDVVLPRSRSVGGTPALFDHPAFTVLPGNVGYMDLTRLGSIAAFDSAMVALADTRGMIIDDRVFGSPNPPLRLFQFIRDPAPWMRRVESVTGMHGTDGPTNAYASEQSWTVPFDDGSLRLYTKPLVVMIWGGNISRGESLAQWLRLSKRATFVGEPTSGTYGSKDGITLPGGAIFHFTVGRALWPDGTKYHGVGVVPDVIATPTLSGLRDGRDEVFEAAVATIKTILRRGNRVNR